MREREKEEAREGGRERRKRKTLRVLLKICIVIMTSNKVSVLRLTFSGVSVRE